MSTSKVQNNNSNTNVHLKTIAITCVGIDGKSKEFAEGHTTMRLVGKADVHQVTRCIACQKAYLKLSSKIRRNKKSLKNAQKRASEAAANAQAIIDNKEMFNNLSKEDQAYLKALTS